VAEQLKQTVEADHQRLSQVAQRIGTGSHSTKVNFTPRSASYTSSTHRDAEQLQKRNKSWPGNRIVKKKR